MNNIKKFEVGATYFARSIGASDYIFKYRILKRTLKTITISEEGSYKSHRRKVSEFNETEVCYPDGTYSFAPIISADKFVLADGTLYTEKKDETYNVE
jgi:hypothetical protein